MSVIWNAVLPHKAKLFLRAEGVINPRHAFLFRAPKGRWVNVNVFGIADKKVSPRARGLALTFPAHFSPQISLK